MVIIWEGRGIVVLVIFVAASVAGIALTVLWIMPVFDLTGDNRIINFAVALSALLSAIASYPLGRLIMKPKGGEASTSSHGAPSVGAQPHDTFCFVDVKYWTYIFAMLTVIMLGMSMWS